MKWMIVPASLYLMLGFGTHAVLGQIPDDFDPAEWDYGSRFALEEVEIWNPVMQKIRNGEPVIGGTIRATDPRTYCATAAAGYDFTWIEMQHEAMSWEQVSRMWLTCPGPAVPGVRIPHEGEENVQKPTDQGALVIVIPTVDTVEEAERAVGWTYFPPLGRRSNGGGQAFGAAMWGGAPGGYRATWNENVVLILMIETLEGVRNAREIARVPGVDGLFAASGDLGNFSGYSEGDPEYEMLVTEVAEAALSAGKVACGPLRWMGVRPDFTCFQGGTEAANIRRGAQSEIQAANDRFTRSAGLSGVATVLSELTASCGEMVYEEDCLSAVRQAAGAAVEMTETERRQVRDRLARVATDNPGQASRIRDAAAEAGLGIEP
jgi:2-keto-3-deoxy-L-rhamnonate aldolase RhmA